MNQAQRLYNTMDQQAVSLGPQLLANERKLEKAFAKKSIQPSKVEQLTTKIGELYGHLRGIHLKANLRARKILEGWQIEQYDQWWGYKSRRP